MLLTFSYSRGGVRFLLYLLTFVSVMALTAKSQAQITLPNPGEKVLVIYYADTTQTCASGAGGGSGSYPQNLMQAVTTVLGNIPAPNTPTITLLPIHAGNVGIYSQLNSVLGLTNLLSFCQVWDMRFLDLCGNQPWTAGQNQPDLITNTGANNDFQLYENFVANGGSLYLQGDHHDYYARNNNMIQLIDNMAASPIISTICGTYLCPDVNSGSPVTTTGAGSTLFTTNYGFNTAYNNLSGATSIITTWAGFIDAADYGSGLPLINFTNGSASGGLMMMWKGAALNGTYGAGKVISTFETNAFSTPLAPSAMAQFETVAAQDAIQNAYAELTGCQRYTVTKAFATNTICVGSSSTFSICVQNNGTVPLTNYSISDTIPTCLQYNSATTSGATPSSNGNASNLYWWNYSSIGVGQSACVTVNYTATTYPPCP